MYNPRFADQIKSQCVNNFTDFKSQIDTPDFDKLVAKILKNDEIMSPITEVYKIKEDTEELAEAATELQKNYPIGTKLKLKGNLKAVSSNGVNKQLYTSNYDKETWRVSPPSSASRLNFNGDSNSHGEVVGYHGDNVVVKSNIKEFGTDKHKHFIARAGHIRGTVNESVEELDEIRRMKTKLNKLDPISNMSVARQKLSNLMKSGKAKGALIANKRRTLNMGDEIDAEDLDALHEVLSKDAKAGD
jgi:hypothetical protein